MQYTDFLTTKRSVFEPKGFKIPLESLNPESFGETHQFQPHLVKWAVELGCAAIFASYGLGKTNMQLNWAKQIAQLTGGRVLIFAPLAVAKQTVKEGCKFGVDVAYCRSQSESDAIESPIVITNYKMLKHFDPKKWKAIVLDESSILKRYTGKIKQQLQQFASHIAYRLCCSANPSPNDPLELLNHAEFLGVMDSHTAISRWFVNDTMNAGKYRLRPYAAKEYWQWVASWAVCLTRPSDLGFSDEGWDLPQHKIHYHSVEFDLAKGADEPDRNGQFTLFRMPATNATSVHQEQKLNIDRIAIKVQSIVSSILDVEPNASIPVWVFTDYEDEEICNAIDNAVSLKGSEPSKAKEQKLEAFSEGVIKILVTKPEIAGLGLNWQHAHHQVFVMGTSYSFELYHQALHRLYRFGQQQQVNTHLVYPSTAVRVQETIANKELQFERMRKHLSRAVKNNQLQIHGKQESEYKPTQLMIVPDWMKNRRTA